MAAKYAIVNMPNIVALPLEDALKLFTLLSGAEQVDNDYGDRDCGFKPAKYKTEVTMRHMTVVQYAAMQMKDID